MNESLTGREREVLRTLADGYTYPAAARRLHIAHSTVKAHVTRILLKLRARNIVHAVAIAYERGELLSLEAVA